MKSSTGFKATVRREINRMTSRKMYLFGIFIAPIAIALFFIALLDRGLPLQTPVAVVDLDHSQMSRTVSRSIAAEEVVKLVEYDESFTAAMDRVRSGEIYGFFVIPENFEADALGGRTPTLEFYSNMTYFVPGTFVFKGFKTVTVATSAGVIKTTLVDLGVDPQQIAPLLQPVSIDVHMIGNPWMNYNYYLSPSFIFGALALMIMLMTVYAITIEIKQGTSPEWIATAGGRMSTALIGKLLPYTVLYIIVAFGILAAMFGFRHFPLNGSLGLILFAAVLFVLASQAFAVFVTTVVPNPRLAFSIVALIGILTFSFAGFSFPVEKMYGAIAIFSYIVPVRYFFLIYINETLFNAGAWYSRWYLVALVAFIPVATLLVGRLKKACLHPVYVP